MQDTLQKILSEIADIKQNMATKLELQEFRKEVNDNFIKVQSQINDLEGITIHIKRDLNSLTENSAQLEKRMDHLETSMLNMDYRFDKKITFLEEKELLNQKDHLEFKTALAKQGN